MKRFLCSEHYTEPTAEIFSAVGNLLGETDSLTVTNILVYLKEHLRYLDLERQNHKEWKKLFKKRTATEILTSKTSYGCSDTTVLFVSMLRAAGIPAKFIEGKRVGKSGGHSWAEILYQDKWIAVDPTHGIVGFDPGEATHGPYVVLSESLGPSDGAIPSYEAWRKIEKKD